MTHWRRIFSKVRSFFRNARVEAELEREIASHLALLEENFRQKGMAPEEARLAAKRAYGGVEQAKQLHRNERSFLWLEQVGQNLRYAFRQLRKSPGFTITILLTLALGIGATTTIFTVDYATLIAPLPYPHPNQLVMVWSKFQSYHANVSTADFLDWQRQSTVFQYLGALTGGDFNLATKDHPEFVQGEVDTPGFTQMLGAPFFLGRDILPEEGQAGKDHVVVLTHKLWGQLGADPNILGTTITLDSRPYTVVGVQMPGLADRVTGGQVKVPLVFKPDQITDRDSHWLMVRGRLKPGVTLQQAQANMDAVTAHLAQLYPKSNKGWGVFVEPVKEDFLPKDRKTMLWLLLGAVGFVLLIACVNVANLLLTRSMTRQKEVAVRGALGATSATIFAQFLTESLLLAALGGILGAGVGYALLQGLIAVMPPDTLTVEADLRLNLPILLFTLAISTLAGLFFGWIPAWYASRVDPAETLKEGGRSGTGVARHRLRQLLVVSEFALALALLAGAGLTIHSFWNLLHVDLGVRTDHVVTFSLPVPASQLKGPAEITAYYRRILASIESLPGISHASAMTWIPVRGPGRGVRFTIAGNPPYSDPSLRPEAAFQMATPDYFQTFGIRLLQGRTFTGQDTAANLKVAMVNEDFADRFLKGVDPLRQRVVIDQQIPGVMKPGPPVEWQIVGVFHNVRSAREDFPEIDVPFWQSPWPSASIGVRTEEDPASMIHSIAAAVHAVDPQIALAHPLTMDQVRNDVLANDRFTAILFASFAGLALLLAAVGIYGVMSFSVAQRSHEIAVRMALGSSRSGVVLLVVKEGLALACVGLGFGLIGAYFVGRAMQSILFDVSPMDFSAFTAVGLILLAAALFACYVPARRAASVEPMQALRTE